MRLIEKTDRVRLVQDEGSVSGRFTLLGNEVLFTVGYAGYFVNCVASVEPRAERLVEGMHRALRRESDDEPEAG